MQYVSQRRSYFPAVINHYNPKYNFVCVAISLSFPAYNYRNCMGAFRRKPPCRYGGMALWPAFASKAIQPFNNPLSTRLNDSPDSYRVGQPINQSTDQPILRSPAQTPVSSPFQDSVPATFFFQ